MFKLIFLLATMVIGNVESLLAVILTHYGYEQPGQPDYDPQSAAGQGAFGFDTAPGSLQNINATGVIAAALSPDVVAQYNLQPGQQFTVTDANGQTYNLVYADNTNPNLTGRIDLYDPNGTFQGSGNQVTALNGGAIIEGGPGGGGLLAAAAGPAFGAETLDVQIIDALLGKFQNAGQAWVATFQNASTWLFWTLATISLVWTGAIMVCLTKHADLNLLRILISSMSPSKKSPPLVSVYSALDDREWERLYCSCRRVCNKKIAVNRREGCRAANPETTSAIF